MKDIEQLCSEIFSIVKENKSIHNEKLYELIENASKEDINEARNLLILHYGLITKGFNLKLDEKGLKYNTFDDYLKSQKPSPDWYRIIPIVVSIIFAGSTIYFANKSYKQKESHFSYVKESDSLKIQISSYSTQLENCEIAIGQLKKKIEQSKEQPSLDTLQTKN